MKAKTFSRRLNLNKKTITNLGTSEQNAVRGGLPLTSYDHIYNCYTMCNTGICCIEPVPVTDLQD